MEQSVDGHHFRGRRNSGDGCLCLCNEQSSFCGAASCPHASRSYSYDEDDQATGQTTTTTFPNDLFATNDTFAMGPSSTTTEGVADFEGQDLQERYNWLLRFEQMSSHVHPGDAGYQDYLREGVVSLLDAQEKQLRDMPSAAPPHELPISQELPIPQSLPCLDCLDGSAREADLERHRNQVHSKNELPRFICDYHKCQRRKVPFHRQDDKGWSTRSGLEKKWWRCSGLERKWWRCTKCLQRMAIKGQNSFACGCGYTSELERVAARTQVQAAA